MAEGGRGRGSGEMDGPRRARWTGFAAAGFVHSWLRRGSFGAGAATGETAMAKGQMRSNREAKKPKKSATEKAAKGATTTTVLPDRSAPKPAKG